MTTTVSHHAQQSRSAPLLASAAVLGAVAVGAVIGVAIQHHTGAVAPARPDPPAVSYPGSAVFDNEPAVPPPPVASYPGSAVFDNQPAGGWTIPRDHLKRPGLTDDYQLIP
jgi:hypothetical protein